MAKTAQQVFEIAMPLIDEVAILGVYDAERTADYASKTPYLLNMLQDEICRDARIYKNLSITKSTETEGYVPVSMPSDYVDMYQLFDTNLDLSEDFKWIGNVLYVPFDFSGVMVYKYKPTTIIALTDLVSVADNIATTCLANGLAAQLITTENPDLASFLQQRFEEMKSELTKKRLSELNVIKDVYDSKLSY